MKSKILALSLTTGLALVASSSAAIVIQNTAAARYTTNNSTSLAYTITNTTLSNVLVFGTYIDSGGAGNNVTNLAYAGTTATALLKNDRIFLGYIVLPTVPVSGNFTFNTTAGSQPDSGYFIWELSGVDTTIAANSGTAGSNLTLTTTSANRFVVDFFGSNQGPGSPSPDGTSNGLTHSANSPFDVNQAGGGGWLAAGTTTLGAAGAYSLGWTPGSGATSNGEAAFGFAAVPEPSAALLLGGMGVLSLLRRRRS